MKQRRSKVLALLLSASMTAAPCVQSMPVRAEALDTAEIQLVEAWETENTAAEASVEIEEAADTSENEAVFGEVIEFDEATDDSGENQNTEVLDEMLQEEAEDGVPADIILYSEEVVMPAAVNTENTVSVENMETGKAYSLNVICTMKEDGSASGMYAMDSAIVTLQEDGTYLVRMHQTSINRDLLALTEDKAAATAHTVVWYAGNGEDGYWFTVPVSSLTEPLHFCMCSEERIDAGKTFGNIVAAKFDTASLVESTKDPVVSSELNILPIPVSATGITVDQREKTIYVGDTFTLTATAEPQETTDKVVWSSSDETIATVDAQGQVTGIGNGTTKIIAKAGTVTAECTVTVKGEFSFSVSTYLGEINSSGVFATPYNLKEVQMTLTDEEGNVIAETAKDDKAFTFAGIDAKKSYTLKVTKQDCYVINKLSPTEYEPAGTFTYTATVTKADADKTLNAFFMKDALLAALKKVPADFSVYEAESAQRVKAAVAAADVNGLDFAKRDQEAAVIEEALSALTLKNGVYAGTAESGTTDGFGAFDVVIFVENGQLKAQFICTQPVYKKLYLGKKSAAKKASDDDPKMLIGKELNIQNEEGKPCVQFTMPINALNKKVEFVANSGSSTTWLTKSLTFTSQMLTNGIVLDQSELLLHGTESGVITAQTAVSYGTGQTLVWTSDNEKVAVVQDGKVQAKGAGTAVITASFGVFSAECKVTVHTEEKKLAEVEATCTKTGLTEGKTCGVCGKVLEAQKIVPAKEHQEETLVAVAATCIENGLTEGKKCSVCGEILEAQKTVPAKGHQEETLAAVEAQEGKTGLTEGKKCSVCGKILIEQKVTDALPVLVSHIKVSAKTSTKIAAGKKVQLTVNVAPMQAAEKGVVWKSSNTKVATVNANGLVTMKKKAGGKNVVITATAKDGSKIYGTIKLTCMKGSVKKITISGKNTVKAGKSVTLKAKVTANKNANKKIVWSSSNTKLAKVTSKGVVKTFKGKKGTVTITAKALDGTNKKKTFKIKIK